MPLVFCDVASGLFTDAEIGFDLDGRIALHGLAPSLSLRFGNSLHPWTSRSVLWRRCAKTAMRLGNATIEPDCYGNFIGRA